MSGLARWLAVPAHGGVYRVPVARHVALTAADEAATLDWARPSEPVAGRREPLLAALAEGLGFPVHFGHNWDAAWDCLLDLTWRDGQPRMLSLSLAEGRADEAALATFAEILEEACHHWAARGRVLVVLVVSDREDLPLVALPTSAP